jgi:hypothetical protein
MFDPTSVGRVRLVAVWYELFPDEDADFDELPIDVEEQCLDREVRLQLADGERLYASWCSEPMQYSLGIRGTSFFVPGEHPARDVSMHPLWAPFVGEEVELAYLDAYHLALALRAPGQILYLATYDHPGTGDRGYWGMDVVRVMRKVPPLPPPWV